MSNKPSWRNLIAQGIVKRSDAGMLVRRGAIRIVEGFNLRDAEKPSFRPAIERLKAHMRRGGKVPALEVSLSADCAGVDVVEGHRRTISYNELAAEGMPVEWIRIEPFEGSDRDRHMRVYTSQDNEKLDPLELARGYKRDKALFNMSNEELAQEIGRTREHVRQMLLLANAPHSVQMMVRDGVVTASTAIDALTEHGDGAAQILGAAKDIAAASGQKKVKPASMRPWTPPARAVLPMVSAVDAVVQAIPESVRQTLQDKPAEDEVIELPAAVVYELLAQQGAIQALRAKAEKKASSKADAAPTATTGGDHAD